MKKLLLCLVIITSSCKSAIISTHNQVMDSYTTKQKVILRFGFPSSKVVIGQNEQWYYDYGNVSKTNVFVPNTNANTTINYNNYDNTITANTTYNSGVGSARTVSYNKYIKFIIDSSTGNVISWMSLGVNNERIDTKQRLKNILYPTSVVIGLGVLWAILDMAAFNKKLAQEDYDYYND